MIPRSGYDQSVFNKNKLCCIGISNDSSGQFALYAVAVHILKIFKQRYDNEL